MDNQRSVQRIKQNKYYEAWDISKKYSNILMNHSKNDKNLEMCFAIHSQYISELKMKRINFSNTKNYIQVWDTLLNTLLNNPKIAVQRGAVKLLHQTNVQRSFRN
uniref:Uncharacterized protein n=1 Tax=viral metagenome TaxID=1070528 RepID=A0A6C0L379_9ZZZZ|tara:strand:+ start:5846 stop:6160 length:315 start_codon:yes stop_codon:yes gene_type:complete